MEEEDPLTTTLRNLSHALPADLDSLYRHLDYVMNESMHAHAHADLGWRVGQGRHWSFAFDVGQTMYYHRAASSPHHRHVCEVSP